MSKHEWDKDGERCINCGAKDWMEGRCPWKKTENSEDYNFEEYTRKVTTNTKGDGRLTVWEGYGVWNASFNNKNVRMVTELNTEVARTARKLGYEWARKL